MDRTCKHKFRPGCEDLEGRQLLSSASTVLRVTPTQFGALNNHLTIKQHFQNLQADFVVQDRRGARLPV